MKYSYAVALGIALLAPVTDGLVIQRRDQPRVVVLPVWKWPGADPVASNTTQTEKRDKGTLGIDLGNYVSHIFKC